MIHPHWIMRIALFLMGVLIGLDTVAVWELINTPAPPPDRDAVCVLYSGGDGKPTVVDRIMPTNVDGKCDKGTLVVLSG